MSVDQAGFDPKNLLEAILFASSEPVEEADLQAYLGGAADARVVLASLQDDFRARGVRLERHETRWAFRTAAELAPHLTRVVRPARRLGKAALETLAIIAYRQPVTRAEIEAIRGVAMSAGTMDALVEAGLVAPKGRKETPGRPVTWGTTPGFLDFFDLASLADLPRLDELEAVGLFNAAADGRADESEGSSGP